MKKKYKLILSVLCASLALTACEKSAQSVKNDTENKLEVTTAKPVNTKQINTKQINILPYEIHHTTLENGLNVVVVPFDSPGVAAFYTVFRVGARDEVEAGVTGFAHFFEHMMFRGTDKYSKEQYSAILKSTGASANANTTQDRTLYYMTGDVSKLDIMFDIESDRFRNLKYSEHEFKTEAGAVKGEYTKNVASPYSQLNEKLQATAFSTHTYQHTTMGFIADIVDMPNQFDYSLTFKERFYRPEYATVIVVGDVTAEQVNTLAKKYFGTWQRGSYESIIPVEPVQKETRYVHLQNDTVPAAFALNYKAAAFSSNDMEVPALDILGSVLFSRTSPLYKKLVIDERKARSLSGGINDSRDPGLFAINASVYNSSDMQYVKDEIDKTLAEFKLNGVDAQKLADIKSALKYRFAMRIDNPSTIANSLASYVQLTGDPQALNKLYVQYDSITVADLQKVVEQYFIESGLTVATISGEEKGNVK